jgi:hypothetical protein
MKSISNKAYPLWIMAIVCVLGFGLQSPAQADSASGMLSTQQLLQEVRLDQQRASVASFLSREVVQSQLQARGVDFQSSLDRVNSLTVEELATLSAQIDELPAGEGILETVLFLLVIFMLLDIAGVTDIFPGL